MPVLQRAVLAALILPAVVTLGASAWAQNAPQPPLNPPPAPAPQAWQPRGTAELRALNKVDAHATQLTLHTGQTVRFGSLSITLQSCVARPPDEAADSAAYLSVQDSHQGAPGFTGWMLAEEPELNMLEHPSYGLRLLACK